MYRYVVVLSTGEITISYPMEKSVINKAFGHFIGVELQSIRYWENRPYSLNDIAQAFYIPAELYDEEKCDFVPTFEEVIIWP